MIIATKTTTPVATDAAMSVPAAWHAPPHSNHQHPPQDHDEQLQPSQSSIPSSTTTTTTAAAAAANHPTGHISQGRTIIIWSLAISPSHQGKGLGKVLLKSYQQRMETSGIADRIALLARRPSSSSAAAGAEAEKEDEVIIKPDPGSGSRSKRGQLVEMYKGFGFEENGDSEVVFAGGGCKDMVYEFAGAGSEGSVGGMMGG